MFPPISFTFLRVSHGVLTVSSGISYAYPSVSSCFLFKVSRLATKLETLQNLIYETLKNCKSKYYENISKKLCSKAITPKYYWSLLKTMLNDKTFFRFRLFFTITTLLQILVKKPISLTLFCKTVLNY